VGSWWRALPQSLTALYHSFYFIREKRLPPGEYEGEKVSDLLSILEAPEPPHRQLWSRSREQRLQDLRNLLPSEADAKFSAAGYELWAHGIQMIAVTTTE
jgi:hypothetical protein